jgi:hypothetical protein
MRDGISSAPTLYRCIAVRRLICRSEHATNVAPPERAHASCRPARRRVLLTPPRMWAFLDAELDTLVLLALMVLAIVGCVLGWFLIGPRK